MNESIFNEFCQAWGARFPGSDLPTAWEEDVRANLKKHKDKVAFMQEELDKELLYVEYLEKLLSDIEKQKDNNPEDEEDNSDNPFITVINVANGLNDQSEGQYEMNLNREYRIFLICLFHRDLLIDLERSALKLSKLCPY